ncbi:MAG: DUF1624 domain-containing protein [Clostridia bacterium]|nr:DUF1624 domain-containing protein [Clostridia bacterium]
MKRAEIVFHDLKNKTEVNIGRQPELDLAKGWAVICMVIIHMMGISRKHEEVTSWIFDYLIDTPLVAPCFVFCLGIGICYTRKRPKELVIRGLGLFFSGLILQRIFLFSSMIDVLQFAGLATIVMAAVKKIKLPPWLFLLFSAGCYAAQVMTDGIITAHPFFNKIISYIVQQDTQNFSLCALLIYAAGGYVFGSYLRRQPNKTAFYLTSGVGGILLLGIYFLCGSDTLWGPERERIERTLLVPITYGTITVFLCAIHFLLRILPERIKQFFFRLSRNVTAIYCIHWPIATWLTFLCRGILTNHVGIVFPDHSAFLLSIPILIVSLLLAERYYKIKQKIKQDRRSKKLAVAGQKK